MTDRAGKLKRLLLLWVTLTILPLSCSPGPLSGSFVGDTEGSDLFVSIVTDGDKVTGYVCDGETTAEWFSGTAVRDSIDLTSAGSVGLVAERGLGDTLDGAVTQGDASEFSFSATRVDLDGTGGGLCRGERVIEGVTYVGGWIVLPDGRQRGAVMGDNGEVIFGVPIDPVTMIAEVPGLGTFEAAPLTPDDL